MTKYRIDSGQCVMNTQREKGVDSRGRCLFRQESWSQAGNGHTQVGKQAGESKLGLQAITRKRLSRVKMNNISQRHRQNELN